MEEPPESLPGHESDGDVPDDVWLAPLPETALVIGPLVPDEGPVPPDSSDLSLSDDAWDTGEDLDPLARGSQGAMPLNATLQMPGDTWLLVGDAPPDLPEEHIAAGPAPLPAGRTGAAAAIRSSRGRKSSSKPSFLRPLVLAVIAAVGAAAVFFGLRASDSGDANRAAGNAGTLPPASVTFPTSPPTTFFPTTVPTTAPAVTSSSSTSTSTTVTTEPPSTTTSTPATTQPPTTTPPTTSRTTVQPATGTQTSVVPFCGFIPGAIIAIDRNGVPIGTQTAGPDGCVSAIIATQ